MSDELARLLKQYDGDPFAVSQPPPAGYSGYDYKPEMTPHDLIKPLGSAQPRERFEWAKNNPELAEAILNRINLLLMAIKPGPSAMPRAQFLPEHTVKAYHGTRQPWRGDTIETPFWASENPTYPHRFAGSDWRQPAGRTVPVEVDTRNYLNIGVESPMEAIEFNWGHGNRMAGGKNNWVQNLAQALGYDGIRWEKSFHDSLNPVIMALNPESVRGQFGAFKIPPAKSPTPFVLPNALADDERNRHGESIGAHRAGE